VLNAVDSTDHDSVYHAVKMLMGEKTFWGSFLLLI